MSASIINFEAMMKIVSDKIEKDSDVEKRNWIMGDESYYTDLKSRDVTAMAIEQMKNPKSIRTLHKSTFDKKFPQILMLILQVSTLDLMLLPLYLELIKRVWFRKLRGGRSY